MLIFRRINGRVVPLQVDTIQKDSKVGLIRELKSNKPSSVGKTNCPICDESVYFLRANGGCLWVEELGYPWEKHSCMSNMIKEKDKKNKYIPSGYVSIDKIKELYSKSAVLGVICQINFYKTINGNNVALFLKTKSDKVKVVLVDGLNNNMDSWLDELCVITSQCIKQFRDGSLSIKCLDILSLADFEKQIMVQKYPQPRSDQVIGVGKRTNLNLDKSIGLCQSSNYYINAFRELQKNNYFKTLIKIKAANPLLKNVYVEVKRDLYETPMSEQIVEELKKVLLEYRDRCNLSCDQFSRRLYSIVVAEYLDYLTYNDNLSIDKLVSNVNEFLLKILVGNSVSNSAIGNLRNKIFNFIQEQPIDIEYIDYILAKFGIVDKDIADSRKPCIWQNEYDVNKDFDLKELLYLLKQEINFWECKKFQKRIGEKPSKRILKFFEIIDIFIKEQQQTLLNDLRLDNSCEVVLKITHLDFHGVEQKEKVEKLNLILRENMAMNVIQAMPLLGFADLVLKLNTLLPEDWKLTA